MNFNELVALSDDGALLPVCEMFYSLQGEGACTGKAAYFIRLSGCDVGCPWCDTKESWTVSTDKLRAVEEIVAQVVEAGANRVVITGGEPTIYPLERIVKILSQQGILVNLETSGTRPICGGFDWVALSPKPFRPPLEENYSRINELKIVIDSPENFIFAEKCAAKVRPDTACYLQPQWSNKRALQLIIDYILEYPRWTLSLQTHKYIDIK